VCGCESHCVYQAQTVEVSWIRYVYTRTCTLAVCYSDVGGGDRRQVAASADGRGTGVRAVFGRVYAGRDRVIGPRPCRGDLDGTPVALAAVK
jgi:hypothetical protein